MAKAKTLDLTVQERLDILDEATQFFANLEDAGDKNMKLGLLKAAALSTVSDCLKVYRDKIMDGAEWTEADLLKGMATVVDEEYINNMIEMKKMPEDEADFYKGGFGLAIGILRGDKESIDGLRELQSAYDDVVDYKLQNKTIGDLLK